MKLIFFCCLLFVVSGFLFGQQSREEKLLQLKNRTDIKVTEVEKDILKLKYPNSKVLYKNIGDYFPNVENRIIYSPTYDSTIIDLRTIDTTIYYHKYRDRKSTRLNSSHVRISYAVFCLKKKITTLQIYY